MLELQLDDTDDAWEENVGRFNIDVLSDNGDVLDESNIDEFKINLAGFFGTMGFSRIFSLNISYFDEKHIADFVLIFCCCCDGIGCTSTVGFPP